MTFYVNFSVQIWYPCPPPFSFVLTPGQGWRKKERRIRFEFVKEVLVFRNLPKKKCFGSAVEGNERCYLHLANSRRCSRDLVVPMLLYRGDLPAAHIIDKRD